MHDKYITRRLGVYDCFIYALSFYKHNIATLIELSLPGIFT